MTEMSHQLQAPVMLPQGKKPAVPIADGGGESKASLDAVGKGNYNTTTLV
jgi:hypothetical protein